VAEPIRKISERNSLLCILLGAILGHRAAGSFGEGAFEALVGFGLLVLIIWTIVAYRRGEPVFIWQKRHG
jgi:hypothetical protein